MNAIFRNILIPILTTAILSAHGYCQTARGDGGKKEEKGKEENRAERLKDREIHEWIISAPGLLISLPVKLVIKGVGNSIGYVNDKNIVDRLTDAFTSDDELSGVRPSYSSRGGAGFKFFRKKFLKGDSKFELLASAGLRSRQKYQLKVKKIELSEDKMYMNITAGYRKHPDESYFGIGPASPADEESNFDHERAFVTAGFGASPGPGLDLIASIGVDNNTVLDGKNAEFPSITESPNALYLPGLENEVRMFDAGLGLEYDSRKSQTNTATGVVTMLYGGYAGQIGNDRYGFWKTSAYIECFIHLFYGRFLKLRLAGEMTDPLAGKEIPFYRLSELGRSETVRGFTRGRFRGRDLILGSVEYNYPIWRHNDDKLMSFVFIDGGQVADDITRDVKPEDIQIGFGGGISLWDSEGETLKLVIGKSKERLRLYLMVD